MWTKNGIAVINHGFIIATCIFFAI